MTKSNHARLTSTAIFGLCIATCAGAAAIASGCGSNDSSAITGTPNPTSAPPPEIVAIMHGTNPDAGDGQRPSPCTTPPQPDTIFCDDFDDGKKVSNGWTVDPDSSDGGVGRLGTVHYASAPASYRAEDGYSQTADISGANKSGYTLDFDVRLHEGKDITLVSLPGPIDIAISPDGYLSLLEEPAGMNASTVFPLNVWVHLQLVANTSTLSLYQDGTLVASLATLNGNLVPITEVTMGAFSLHQVENVAVNFDNVLVRSPSPPADAGAPDSGANDAGNTDAGSDSGSADSGATDSGATDAGTPYVIVRCINNIAESSASWIDSDGTTHGAVNTNGGAGVPVAGQPDHYSLMETIGTPLTPAALATLLAATQELDTSTAGYTTTTGNARVGESRTITLTSSGAPGVSVSVASYTYVGGSSTYTSVESKDPDAPTIWNYCPLVLPGND